MQITLSAQQKRQLELFTRTWNLESWQQSSKLQSHNLHNSLKGKVLGLHSKAKEMTGLPHSAIIEQLTTTQKRLLRIEFTTIASLRTRDITIVLNISGIISKIWGPTKFSCLDRLIRVWREAGVSFFLRLCRSGLTLCRFCSYKFPQPESRESCGAKGKH